MKLKSKAFTISVWLIVIFLTVSCSKIAVKDVEDRYHLTERSEFYDLNQWSFSGRLAIVDAKESWTANLEWQHHKQEDRLKLSGVLGQGSLVIIVTEQAVILDRGDGKTLQSNDINAFIEQQLGVAIPVKSLRYWVLGLTNPDKDFVSLADGFEQEHWIIQYLQMQQVNKKWMPRKLKAMRDKMRLKLVIDHWIL